MEKKLTEEQHNERILDCTSWIFKKDVKGIYTFVSEGQHLFSIVTLKRGCGVHPRILRHLKSFGYEMNCISTKQGCLRIHLDYNEVEK